jgi:hypothetical protein
LYQGEFLSDGKPLTRQPIVKNSRAAAPYTFGYNHAVFVHRVHDVLSVVGFVKNYGERPSKELTVVGLDGAAPWAAAARAQSGGTIDEVVIDTAGFRFGKVLDFQHPDFLPGGAKYGDLPALLALGAPGRVWVSGETDDSLAVAQTQYEALNAGKNLIRFNGTAEKGRAAAVDWLLAANQK